MFYAIIPIKSKSEGLKNKNILEIKKGINLTNFTIKKLLDIKEIKKIYILTDSESYKKKIINHKKIDKNYIRKNKLSGTDAKIDHLIYDFFKTYEKSKKNHKVLLFQVTSPILSKKEITKTLRFITKNNISSLMHVTRVLESPYEMIVMYQKKWSYLMNKRIINRQNYKKKFMFITGSLFYFSKFFFKRWKKIFNIKTIPYEIDRINFIDIDDKFTFELAKKNLDNKTRN